MDIHAASHFVRELLLVGKVRSLNVRFTIIANRVRANTLAYKAFQRFLDALDIPLITYLRDTHRYLSAAEQGLSILELQDHRIVKADLKLWEPLLDWLEGADHPAEQFARIGAS